VNENGITAQNIFLNGQIIATQVRVLGSNNFNRAVTYFDDKYHVIQNTMDNAAGGKDRVTKILSFDGKITSDFHNHTSRFFTTALLTKQVYTYDQVDRLLSLTHQTASQEIVTLNQSTYNELGQLLNKKIHQSPSHPNSLQKVDYYYNIRGWLNGINRPLTAESGYEESDLFDQELHYTKSVIPGSAAQYNGNIAEEILKVGYDEGEDGYCFLYDKANRMTGSAWGYPWSNGNPSWTMTKRFDESGISYDHNGNILTLTRYFGDWNKIDSLKYSSYTGNQLAKVDDIAGPNLPVGFQDKNNGSNPDYTYDPNGNLISDYNKSITSITYNYLNLPSVIAITGKGTITYTYDASGSKLQKTTLDQTVTPNKTTSYFYAGDYVYRNGGTLDTLEFISHPEGRLRPVRIDTTQAISMANLKYIYDYYLRDHLGSVRAVLTTEQQTDLYAATMELANASKEDALFSNVSSTAANKLAGMSNDNNNQRASKLNGAVNISGNKRVGPSIILKVMTGDTISISTYSWYAGTVQPAATGVSAISTELIPLLTAGINGLNGSKGGTIPSAYTDPFMSNDIGTMISTDSTTYSNLRPKAFLNWMVVGEDYYPATNSANHVKAIQIPICNTGDTLKQIVGLSNMVVRRNGWIYIYLSNESAQDVYFDNLVINLKHGPLVEQKDFYPFGMENPALSTKALKYQYNPNRNTYNGKELQAKEFSDGTGLEEYDYGARMYDPQIGRWMVVDPLSDKSRRLTPYAYAFDNPIRFIDPNGMEGEETDKVKYTYNKTTGKITQEYVSDKEYNANTNNGTNTVTQDEKGNIETTVNGQNYEFHKGEWIHGGTSSQLSPVIVFSHKPTNAIDNVNKGIIPICCTPRKQPPSYFFVGIGQFQWGSGSGEGSTAGPYVPGMVMLPPLDMSGKNSLMPWVMYSFPVDMSEVPRDIVDLGAEALAEPDDNDKQSNSTESNNHLGSASRPKTIYDTIKEGPQVLRSNPDGTPHEWRSQMSYEIRSADPSKPDTNRTINYASP
jgi:RHS repeat-associated protein